MARRQLPRLLAVTLALSALLASAAAVAAHGPTCSDLGGFATVHGQHVVRDYVTGGAIGSQWPPRGAGSLIAGSGASLPGGPGPSFHFVNGFAPGASFCNSQAASPGFHVP